MLPNWPNDWAVLWGLICLVHLHAGYYHVTYEFQSESTFYGIHSLQIWCLLWARSSWTFSQAIECEFTLKLVPDIIIRYSHMHHTDKYSQYSSIIRPVWLNGWVFVCELSGCRFESHCCQLNVRYDTCFEQGVPWHSGKLSSVDALWNLYVTW